MIGFKFFSTVFINPDIYRKKGIMKLKLYPQKKKGHKRSKKGPNLNELNGTEKFL